jgi:hypothetical protein
MNFNIVWTDVISQGMKYLDEESIEEIIISYTYHTMTGTLSRRISKENIPPHKKQGIKQFMIG